MAAYGYAGAGRKQGKMTVAFNHYTKAIQDTVATDDGGAAVGQGSNSLEFIQSLAQQTRIIHVTCTSLMQRTRLQATQFSPLSEEARRQVLTHAKDATNAGQALVTALQPYANDYSFLLLVESFRILAPSIVNYIRHVSLVLLKLPRAPNAAEVQQAQVLFDDMRAKLKEGAEQIKYFQQTQEQLEDVPMGNIKDFAALCRDTITMQATIETIASHSDPELAMDPQRAEDLFIELAGKYVSNIKTIIKFCMSMDLTVQEETLVDQSTRMISSAKLLFRTRSVYADTLFKSDKEAVLESLRTIILDISKFMKGEGGSPKVDQSPSRPWPPVSAHSAPGSHVAPSASFTFGSGQSGASGYGGGGGGVYVMSSSGGSGSGGASPAPYSNSARSQTFTAGGGPSAAPAAPQKEEEEYKPHLRAKLVEEIMTTEKTYVSNLGIVKSIYMMKLKGVKWLKETEFDVLFANLGDIVNFNACLSRALHDKINETKDDLSRALLGDLFVSQSEGMIQYAKYINNFDNSLKVLEQLQKNKVAVSFFQEIIDSSVSSGTPLLDLGAYLIMPVQRLPRYELLLRELRKFTPSFHPDSDPIDEALNKMKIVNAKINEMKREEENRVKWNAIKENLAADRILSPATGELIPGLNKDRWVLNQGNLDVSITKNFQLNKGMQSEKLQKKTRMYVFLFDDMLLFTEIRKKKYFIKFFVPFDAESVSVAPNEDAVVVSQKEIVMGYVYEFALHASTPEELKGWFRHIQSAIATSLSDKS